MERMSRATDKLAKNRALVDQITQMLQGEEIGQVIAAFGVVVSRALRQLPDDRREEAIESLFVLIEQTSKPKLDSETLQ